MMSRMRTFTSKLLSEPSTVSFLFQAALIFLRNDPDKNYSIFYCSAAIRFPHVETVDFSGETFINQGKAGYEIKCI